MVLPMIMNILLNILLPVRGLPLIFQDKKFLSELACFLLFCAHVQTVTLFRFKYQNRIKL